MICFLFSFAFSFIFFLIIVGAEVLYYDYKIYYTTQLVLMEALSQMLDLLLGMYAMKVGALLCPF